MSEKVNSKLPGHHAIIESGLRLGDTVRMKPFSDKSRAFKLGRTRVLINHSEDERILIAPTNWRLTGPMSQDGFELTLDDQYEEGRFLLRSLGRSFFIHNGIPTWKSYIMRGDVVDIGYNRIEFMTMTEVDGSENQIDLSIVQSKLNVLITGETGTGKTRLAKKIHEESLCKGKFVHLNLSAIPEGLIASELFGHLKGSFTGATHHKVGAVEEASGGTLFLDEVDSLSLDLQVKLLLFLDNKKFRPLGANFEKTSSPRMIFASGQELGKMVEQGKMRRDFYFRLASGFRIQLNPLREQREEIWRASTEWASRNNVTIAQNLKKFLQNQDWPGNYRQLIGFLDKKKALTRSSFLCSEESDEDHMGYYRLDVNEEEILTLELIKQGYARKVYRRLGSNLKLTARTLDISPNTLRKFLYEKEQVIAA